MWVTKNVVSQEFYDLEDLRSFLDCLIPMDTSAPVPPRNSSVTDQTTLSRAPPQEGRDQTDTPQSPIPEDETWSDS
ncbi:hypothetical protein NDU88_002609 [Pleurodeles waltl]|uniref:Uncharacterized protein n=1 Tax=Pleurodeles waltl TaxID=8319 RepID=A0AAV7P756_PLEWA|nr:hypothetical protein NDU88_002609 [Pleurodeles waltl]